MAEALVGSIDKSVQDNSLDYRILQGDACERIKEIESNSVDLIITSPPYGSIKQYSSKPDEIGSNQTYLEYHVSIMEVFRECVRVLHPGCRMVINIGDEFVSTTKSKPYHIKPHASQLIANLINEFPDDLIYTGTIHWQKVTSSSTSGGGKIMGSVYHPRNGHFFVNYEHIITFKKLGRAKKPDTWAKAESKFSLEQRREWFRDTWEISPEEQNNHIAMFPMEIPRRLIQMYSFAGETVLDPFAGSGTTLAAAAELQRSGVGIELGFDGDQPWQEVIENKVSPYLGTQSIEFV